MDYFYFKVAPQPSGHGGHTFFPVTPSLNHIRFDHGISKAFAVFHAIQKDRFIKLLFVSKLYMIMLMRN